GGRAGMSLRRTKLVCTMGPASVGRVDELLAAGMDVARINLSHGDAASQSAAADRVRAASDAAERPVTLLADLPGPKIRLGTLADGELELTVGATLVLGPGGLPITYDALAADLEPGDRILLADGAAELRTLE